MGHSPHHLTGGAYVQAGVAVQCNDICHLTQPVLLPHLCPQAGRLPFQQTDQFGEGPPFSLPAHILLVLGTEGRPAEKEIETAAVFLIESLDSSMGAGHPGSSLLSHGGSAVRQVGQNAEAQLWTAVPVGQPVSLQQGGQLGAAVLPGEQGHDHAKGAILPWDTSLQLHPGDGPGRHYPNQVKVQDVLHDIGQGKQ